jgi:hypothetical protein
VSLLLATAKRILSMRSVEKESPERARIALLAAGIGGALTTLFISGQFADYLRAELLVWLYAITVALSRVSKDVRAREAVPVPAPPAPPTPHQRPRYARVGH